MGPATQTVVEGLVTNLYETLAQSGLSLTPIWRVEGLPRRHGGWVLAQFQHRPGEPERSPGRNPKTGRLILRLPGKSKV